MPQYNSMLVIYLCRRLTRTVNTILTILDHIVPIDSDVWAYILLLLLI